jgi:hypothetical protein
MYRRLCCGIAAAAFLAVSCSGAATTDEYVAAVNESSGAYDVRTDEIFDAYAIDVAAALGRVVGALDGQAPPGDLEGLHDEYLATLQRAREAVPLLITQLREAGTLRDISAVINGSAFGAVQPRVLASCRALQDAAAGLERGLDLHCGSTETP